MCRIFVTIALMVSLSASASQDPNRRAEHGRNKIVIKVKDKNGNWKTEKEIFLMFDNNRKSRQKK